MIIPYSKESLQTYEKINNNNGYTVNKIYRNTEHNILYYINSKGYMHVLRPCTIGLNGKITGYGLNDLMLTKDNMLQDKGYYCTFNTKEELIQYINKAIEQE